MFQPGYLSSFDKYKKMSKIHKYWSRKPWNLMSFMISKHSIEGDVVLDPFCGSGTVGLEALLLNRNFVGYDLNPFACFLTENTLISDFDETAFMSALEELKQVVGERILEIYKYEQEYVIYSIPGEGNKKPYNLVLGDKNFKKTRTHFDSNLDVKYGFFDEDNIRIPDAKFPEKFYKDRFSYKGVKRISDLISQENLEALSVIWTEINKMPDDLKNEFKLVLTNTILHVSKLKSENIRPLGVNNYWIPNDFINENVFWRFLDRSEQYLIAKREIHSRFESVKASLNSTFQINNDSSLPLLNVDDSSIDYILTDPPYGDVIQYSELTFIWNTWIEKTQIIQDELIINPVQNKDMDYFVSQLRIFMAECHRVLRNGGKITICFQNKDPEIWFQLIRIAKTVGFSFDSVEAFDYLGSPYNKNWSGKSPKMDLYVTLLKGENSGQEKTSEQLIDISHLVDLTLTNAAPDGRNEIADNYSRFIAFAIVSIMKGVDVKSFTKKELSKHFFNSPEVGGEDEGYYQGDIFQNI
jgi:16S rRNA G966 N2-methylase RsmD